MTLSYVMAVFALIGAADYIIGNKFGLGKEFEKGINMLGIMMMSMVGMILISPVIAELMTPLTNVIIKHTPFDPSFISGILLANDMGGAPLSMAICENPVIGEFNGLIVASTMGATISFSIPLAISANDKKYHTDILIGVLCGISTIPIGAFVSGLMLKIPVILLLIDLIPLIIFSVFVIVGLLKFPSLSVRALSIFGKLILAIIVASLALGIFEFLTGIKVLKSLAPLSEGVDVIVNSSCVMAGSFPLIHIVSKILNKPITEIGKKLKINNTAAVGFLASVASFAISVRMLPDMDKKGRIFNVAFAVSGAFTLAGHLAFTLAMNPDFVIPSTVGKIVGGITSVIAASIIYKKLFGSYHET